MTSFEVVAPLLPRLLEPGDREAFRAGGRSLSERELASSASDVAHRLAGHGRVAVWATPSLETCVAVAGAILAGVQAVPINPKMGARELEHVLTDSAPTAVAAPSAEELPEPLRSVERVPVDLDAPARPLPSEPGDESTALVFYTSGTTGPPKGVLIPRRAIASNLDALAEVWRWTATDVLTHALPLFHVHGLVLGVLGPLRTGGSLRHAGRFSVAGNSNVITDQVG